MSDIFCHIGLRKTGTTFLQDRFFPALSGIKYLGKTEFQYPQFLMDIHYLDDYAFNKRLPAIKEEVAELISMDANVLFSSEAFTNTGVINQQMLRLKSIIEDINIIVTVRDPIDMLLSHYILNIMERGHYLPLMETVELGRRTFDQVRKKTLYLPDFFIEETIETLSALFGPNKIKIYRYEDIFSDPLNFIIDFTGFTSTSFDNLSVGIFKEKKNGSGSFGKVIAKRQQNFYEHVSNLVDKPNKLGNLKLKYYGQEFLTKSDRKFLEQYFSGKTLGYY